MLWRARLRSSPKDGHLARRNQPPGSPSFSRNYHVRIAHSRVVAPPRGRAGACRGRLPRRAFEAQRAALTPSNSHATGTTRWTHGGAYLYWAQGAEEGSGGELLYAGEAEDLARRQSNHLLGGPATGHKFTDLTAHFVTYPKTICGLALVVVRPASLDWLDPPDDEPPVLDDGALKRAGEGLEGLLLRASLGLFQRMPLFNGRGDASRFRHDDNVAQFQSLVRFILDYPDATRDFVTFEIRGETAEASARLAAETERYRALRGAVAGRRASRARFRSGCLPVSCATGLERTDREPVGLQ